MADLTLDKGQTLPERCALTGSTTAPLRLTGTLHGAPAWLWVLLFIPFGFVIFLAARNLLQKEFPISYSLSEEGAAQMQRRRRGIRLLSLAGGLSFLPPILLHLPLLFLIPMVLMPLGIWLQHRYGWPFQVSGYTATTVTLTGLPPEFQEVALSNKA